MTRTELACATCHAPLNVLGDPPSYLHPLSFTTDGHEPVRSLADLPLDKGLEGLFVELAVLEGRNQSRDRALKRRHGHGAALLAGFMG